MTNNAYSNVQIRKSFVHFLTGKIASAILGFVMLMLLVRLLSRQEFGGYITLLAIFELLQLGSNFGVFAAAFRYIPELRTHNNIYALYKLIKQLLIFRCATLIVSGLFLIGMSNNISIWLNMPWLSHGLAFYALVLLFEGFARYTDILFDSLLLQGYAQISIVLRNGLRVLALLLFMFIPSLNVFFNLECWIFIEAFSSLFGGGLSLFWIMKSVKLTHSYDKSERPVLDYKRIKDYAVPAFLAQILGLAQGPDLIKLFIARVFDIVQVGAFGFAAAINSMIQRYLPVFLLIGMIRPVFISSSERGLAKTDLVRKAALIFKLNLFILMPLCALILAIGEPIMLILSGGKFPEAATYFVIFIILLMFQTLHAVMGLLALVVEESFFGLLGTVFGLVGIFSSIVLSHWFGPLILCVGLIVSEICWCVTMQYALYHHDIAFKVDFLGILKLFVAACFSGMSVYVIWVWCAEVHVLSAIVVSSVIGGVVFLLSAFLLKPFLENERSMVNRMLPRPFFVW